MGETIYDNDTIQKHSLYCQCKNRLNDIAIRDYGNGSYFDSQIECLDMDTYETSICHGQPDCTVDAVIGIAECNNKRKHNFRLKLVELRLEYKSARGLSKSNIESKVTHTRTLLGAEMPIDQQSVFVFSDNVAEQARHWVESRKKEGGEIRYFVVNSLSAFNANIRSYDSLPYSPINPSEIIAPELAKLLDDKQYHNFVNQFRYWMKQREYHRYRNSFECHNIENILIEVWKYASAKPKNFSNDDEELEYMIFEEDVSPLISSFTA